MSGEKKLPAHPVIPQNTAEHPVLVIILDGKARFKCEAIFSPCFAYATKLFEDTVASRIRAELVAGWGEAPDNEFNGIYRAKTPFMDSLKKSAPDRWTLVSAHGKWVGLNESDMGNSEVIGRAMSLMFLGCIEATPGLSDTIERRA